MTSLDLEQARLLINYTDRDFIALVVALRNRIATRYPQITDFNTARLTQMMIELFAAVGDMLSYMQDRQAGETNLVTARQRQNIINLALSIGYQGASAKAAQGPMDITIENGAQSGNLTLTKGEVIITTKEPTNPQSFQLYETVTIPAGDTTVQAVVKNSLSFSEDFFSDGTASQEFILEETPFLDDGSIEVRVNNELWTQQENFLNTGAADKHFIIRINQDDKAKIIFGDGVNGLIPLDNFDIIVNYETGGGVLGNQAIDTITENDDDFFTDLNEQVSLVFSNPATTEGGADRETDEEIRFRAPRALSTLTRSVTRRDFSVNVEDDVEGVARAIAFSSDQDQIIAENTVHVYVVPVGGGLASGTLIADVEDCLTNQDRKPMMLTTDLAVFSADYLTVTLTGQIYIDQNVPDVAAVKSVIRNKIQTYFDFQNIDPTTLDYTIGWGQTVRWSPLVDIIQSTRGVRYIQNLAFNGQPANDDLAVPEKEIPLLDDSNFDTAGGIEFIQVSS